MSDRTCLAALAVLFTFAAPAAATPPSTGTLTVQTAVELALEHSGELAAARASAAEAGAAARLAADWRRSEAYVTTTPAFAHGLPMAVVGTVPAIVGVEATRTLYDVGGRVAELKGRAAQATATAQLERVRADLVRRVVSSYARCWTDEVRLGQARARQQATDRILQHAIARAAEGREEDLAVERLRLRLAEARMATLERESERHLDRLELVQLMGWPSDGAALALQDPAAAIPSPAPGDDVAAARAADPDLQAAADTVEALGRAASLEGRALAPVVQAQAQYSRLSRANHFDRFYRNFEPDAWSVGVSVAVPLWTGGRRDDAAAGTEAALFRASSARRARESELEVTVRRARSDAELAQARTAVAQQGAGVAEEALRIARLRAGEGRGEPDEVETCEVELAKARDAAALAALESLTARVALLALRGDLIAAFAPPARSAPASAAAPEGLPLR